MNVCDRTRTIKVREEEYPVPCGSRYCPACGTRWMGDQRVQAVAACEQIPGDVALITVTGPGRRTAARCAAARGQSVADWWRWWNASAAARWRGLHLEASGAPRRRAKKDGATWTVEFRVWEFQKRGAKHAHVVAPMGTESQRTCTIAYVRNLAAAASWWGFGFILGGDKDERPEAHRAPRVPRVPAGAAARYVAKYVASTGAGKDNLVSTVRRVAQRGSVLYVNPRRTRASGCNMTTLRARRRIYARHKWARDSERGWAAGCLVDAVQRRRAPLDLTSMLALRRLSLRHDVRRVVDASTGEVVDATRAPRPLRADTSAAPRTGAGRTAVVVLASVLVRDPQRPELGPTRTTIEDVQLIGV